MVDRKNGRYEAKARYPIMAAAAGGIAMLASYLMIDDPCDYTKFGYVLMSPLSVYLPAFFVGLYQMDKEDKDKIDNENKLEKEVK